MPGKIKVKVLAGRNLPVMDRASDTTDAFVEIKFGGVTHKTDVCRKSLNPHWNSTEWYRFEVDESELQDEPLQLRLMDHDTYSANDAIGKVVISLGPLLAREANNVKGTPGSAPGAVMSGWIPVFDTMHGIRGELNVIVKVELFSDFNKYKTSSCGVQFFHCPSIPPGYRATSVHGFVEELVVNDDPEYQWIDKIRTPRASNEARQVAFIKLSNQVQRLVGLKAAELGANAVVGYQQEFDLEGEAGVVARAIGTAISVTPLPMPSQTMNIPPCTQQQLKKCLDILATDDETVTDLNEYYQTHQEELMKMISILNPKDTSMLDETEAVDDDDDKIEQGRLSIHSFTGSMSLFHDDQIHHRSLRHLSEDQTDLNKLLSRKSGDDDDDSDSSGPIQKIKKMKTNFFTKRFSRRKRDKKEKQDDQISLKSNSSDTSRISLAEIKNEFKKRFKKPKIRKVFTNPEGEGVEMASILARSVIHTQTSLACIAETQDSEHSAAEMRRTSESEPNTNVSDDDKQRNISMDKVEEIKNEIEGITVPDIHFSSLKNMSSEEAVPERVRKISESCPSSPMVGRTENLLKLPGDKGYFDSVSSALSGESSEAYSSSEEEEDESSEIKSDSEIETVETTASVVNSVLNHKVNPDFIAQMEKKLTTLEKVHPTTTETCAETQLQEKEISNEEPETKQESVNIKVLEKKYKLLEVASDEINEPQEKVEINEPSTSAQGSDKCVSKPNMHHIRIHNPFAHKKTSKSFSAPSSPVEKNSFVYRSSKRIKHQLAKLSKSSMIKSISHYSLLPKKKEDTKNLSQPGSGPGSSSNVPSRAPSDTVLGSLFLSYSDLLSLDKEALLANRGLCKSDEGRTKVSMYIGSEPVSRTSLSGPSFPSHYREEHGHRRLSSLKPEGLIHTAMETILIDKVDTLLLPTSPDPDTKNNKQFFDDVSEKLEEHKNRGSSGKISMGQVQSNTGSTTPRIVAMTPKRLSDDFTAHAHKTQDSRNSVPESKGLVHTAMETVVMDKAHAILPETPEVSYHLKGSSHDIHEKAKHKDHNILSSIKITLKEHHVNLDSVFCKHQAKKESSPDIKSGGLIHTAMQTMLMDRAQSMIPDTPEPIPIRTEPVFERGSRSRKTSETSESSGLIHSAMQTILMDKFRAVIPNTTEPIPIHLDDTDSKSSKKNDKHDEESGGLVHNAMQTILIDKVQTVIPDTKEPLPIHIGDNDNKSEKGTELQTEESKGLTQTMLMDKAQSVIPDTSEPTPITTEHVFVRGSRSRKSSETSESSGLIHSAMQTILMDKFRAVIPNTTEPIPIHLDDTDSKSSKKNDKHDEESGGLVHNAMQTILIDKVQTVIPDTKEPLPIHIGDNDNKSEKGTELQTEESKELTQTMLMDKAQSVIPDTSEPTPIRTEHVFVRGSRSRKSSETSESSGLIHSAMQTIVMDKFRAVIPNTTEPIPIHLDDTDSKSSKKNDKHDEESGGLVHNAMQTILIDKVQTVIPETKDPLPIHVGDNDEKSEKGTELQAEKSKGLTNRAIQTMLIEKVQAVLPDTPEPIPIHLEDLKPPKNSTEVKEPKGLVQSAIQTMLIEKVQSVLPGTFEPIPIHFEDDTTLKSNSIDIKPEGFLQSAMETNLPKVHSLISPVTTIVGDVMHNEKTRTYRDEKDYSQGSLHSAMKTILIDKFQTICPNSTDPDLITDLSIEECKEKSVDNTSLQKSENESRLVKTAMENISLDKVQRLVGAPDNIPIQIKPTGSEDLKSPALVETAMKTILMDKLQSAIATTSTNAPETSNVCKDTESEDTQGNTTKEEVLKSKKLIRQDSIHSLSDTKESKMSNEDLSNMSSKVTRPPVLQHFHPILSGLETIPSMSESSFDRSVDGESSFETNNASVCDNSHAACGFGRSERDRDRSEKDRGSPRHARAESYGGKDPVAPAQTQPQASLNSTSTPMGIHRRSSDSDLSVTPKGGSLNTSAGNVGSGGGAILRPSMNTDNLDMLEYPFLTMTEYPPGFIVHIGGTVCARSVKLVDGGGESAARAAWWAELRTELRAHARALRCNAVIAYTDTCTICEDVCVLSASGTAAVINLDCDYNVDADAPITVTAGNKVLSEEEMDACSVAHVPYSPGTGPYRAELSTCGGCRRARVPAVLLATCAKPNRLVSYTKAVTLTAVAARVRRAGPGAEPGARDISDQLPFLEYELHRLLLAKLRMQGANALFGLSTQVALGERCVVALASGIAVKLTALPDPNPPTIKATEKDKEALDLQRKLWDSFTANKAANGYDIAGIEHASNGALPEIEREEPPVLDLCADKDACVLELDEAEDVSTARALCVVRSHAAAYTPALRSAVVPPHAFAQVSRGRLALSQQGGACAAAERHVARALDSVTYKLRRLQPAAVAASFQLELPEDEIQLVVSGTAIPLVDPSKEQLAENGNIPSQGAVSTGAHNGTGDGDDDIFTLDEEQLVRSSQPPDAEEKPQLNGTVPTTVSLTTLSQIAGVKVARRVCALRLLFVRETTAVRELGGLSGFLHTFTCEVLAIARAYTAALGGNALTSFYIRQLMLQDNAHKNQGQCLMSVGGDIVHITY